MSSISNLRLVNLLTAVSKEDPENSILLKIYETHGKYTPESLVQELREDASNTIGRWLTGAVDYDEAVKRVAEKVGVDAKDLTNDETENELLIIQKAIQDYVKKHPEVEEQLKDVAKELGDNTEFINILLKGSATAFLTVVGDVGAAVVQLVIFRVMAIFAGLQTALTAARFAALAVPFLNVIMTAWLIWDISGPAYRKIVPSVFNIALLRIEMADKIVPPALPLLPFSNPKSHGII